MKRIAIFALIAAFTLAWAGAASAAEIKATGEFKVNANLYNNAELRGNNDNQQLDDFNIFERARISLDFVASENLMANLYLQVGSASWGNSLFEIGRGDATPGTIAVRRAFVNFKWPDTQQTFYAGYWNVSLPSAWYHGGSILNEEVASIAATGPILDGDFSLSYLAGYARAYDDGNRANSNALTRNDEIDGFYLAAPMSYADFNFTPFFAYFWRGKGAVPQAVSPSGVGYSNNNLTNGLLGTEYSAAGLLGGGSYAWWAGLALSVDVLDPFKFMFDFNYGHVNGGDNNKWTKREGYFLDFAAQYNGLDFMTPEILVAYGSGEDKKWDNGSERMPSLDPDWGIDGSTWFNGSSLLSGDLGNGGSGNAAGYWAVGLLVKDITFIENLYHTFNIIYAGGTNSHKMWTDAQGYNPALTVSPSLTAYGTTLYDKDYVFEIDFNHKYQIYEELAAIVELSWDYYHTDQDTWTAINTISANPGATGTCRNLWKAGFGLIYSF